MTNQIKSLSSSEVLNLAAQNEKLFCPICNALLVTIPEKVAEGGRPLGVSCPMDKEHFFVYGEDAFRVQTMREEMRAFREKENNK
jgi:hypothetical protein